MIRVFLLLLFVVTSTTAYAETKLYNWNHPSDSGLVWEDWTYFPNGANDYGAVGWRKNDGRFYSGDSNWYPRVHQQNGYGNRNLAVIDTEIKSPSTEIGSSLKVYDTGESSTYQAAYWYMWGDNFGTHGLADSTTNRLSFYLLVDAPDQINLSTGAIPNGNMHFGTYLCWPGGAWDSGADCPVEASNQHYYHYLTVPYGDMPWIHVQIDQHPTHIRNGSEPNEPDNNPAFAQYGKHYFESMNSFYLEIRYPHSGPTAYWLDEVKLWTQTQDENENSIGSHVWVGYWPSTNKWQMGFGSVWPGRPIQATFEVRWSTSPITNANYDSANIAEPEFRERGTSNTFTLSDNGWSKQAWTQFEIPQNVVESADKMYFAIRDVSSTANSDGYNSPTTNVKTIDYALAPDPNDNGPPIGGGTGRASLGGTGKININPSASGKFTF